jgi:hypothetical protein
MSAWTHPICRDCWMKKFPNRKPIQVIDSKAQNCCYCDTYTAAGIFVRENPMFLRCQGKHDE